MADLSSSFNSIPPKSDASYATSDYSSTREDTDTDQNNDDSTSNLNANNTSNSNNSSPKPSSSKPKNSKPKDANSNNTPSSDPNENAEFADALEDVHTRFVLNAPEADLEAPEKLFFALEQAWWFYEDWICDPAAEAEGNDTGSSNLPRFTQLRPFARILFDYSPLLPSGDKAFSKMWNVFAQYKRKISNYGCILLNADCTHMVLCKVWNGKSWSFPSGKINQGETGVEAAARETYEETGFDPHCHHGKAREIMMLQASSGGTGTVPWTNPLQDKDGLSYQESQGGKRRTNFVCVGVPQDFPFEPVCRKEVSNIAWFPIDKIPKSNYAVGPFLPQLKRWIKKYTNKQRKKKNKKAKQQQKNKSRERGTMNNSDSQYTTPRRGGGGSRQGSRQRVRDGSDLIESGLADPGGVAGWSEEDMFQANEQLLGRKIEYDGNPHQFAEKGFFGGSDPHAFHVVGGSFLNSSSKDGPGGISSLAPPPHTSKLQPLFRKESNASEGDIDEEELEPFFSDDGATPWGDVVSEAKGGTDASAAPSARTIPAAVVPPPTASANTTSSFGNDIFTDAEITRRSQAQKQQRQNNDPIAQLALLRAAQQKQYEADMAFVRNWVANLPKPKATPHFGEFRLDAEAIVNKAMEGL